MSRVNLEYVHSYRDRHGKLRNYFRRHGFKTVKLPGKPGSPEFAEAYAAALAGETATPIEIAANRTKPGSVSAAVATYLSSVDFAGLAQNHSVCTVTCLTSFGGNTATSQSRIFAASISN